MGREVNESDGVNKGRRKRMKEKRKRKDDERVNNKSKQVISINRCTFSNKAIAHTKVSVFGLVYSSSYIHILYTCWVRGWYLGIRTFSTNQVTCTQRVTVRGDHLKNYHMIET